MYYVCYGYLQICKTPQTKEEEEENVSLDSMQKRREAGEKLKITIYIV